MCRVLDLSLRSNLQVNCCGRVYGTTLRSSLFDSLTSQVYKLPFCTEFTGRVYRLSLRVKFSGQV